MIQQSFAEHFVEATDEQNQKLERTARAICTASGDDPDALAYPPMQHMQARKPYVIYVPTFEHAQPKPCWNWYIREALAAIEASA